MYIHDLKKKFAYIAKKLQTRQYVFAIMPGIKRCDLVLILGETFRLYILSINSTCFKLETQNQNFRSTTKTVLRIWKRQSFLEPDAFRTSSFAKIASPATFLLYDFLGHPVVYFFIVKKLWRDKNKILSFVLGELKRKEKCRKC